MLLKISYPTLENVIFPTTPKCNIGSLALLSAASLTSRCFASMFLKITSREHFVNNS